MVRRKKEDLLRGFAYDFPLLQKTAKQLHRLDECSCNYGLTPRQEKREKRLEQSAQQIARKYGLHAFHQGDPRGGTLYLVKKKKHMYTGDYTTQGIFIPRL